ncbi:MAG: hypothetical protein K2M04_03115 [Muribaculaceae bacterium]|nr:hypothetical protein [Muribaculaceae bacterium]
MKKTITYFILSVVAAVGLSAQDVVVLKETVTEEVINIPDSVALTQTNATSEQLKFDHRSGFTWGLDLGSSVDMSGRDMTYVELDACFGYRTPGISLVGIGASIGIMTTNSSRLFPVYALVRTSFSTRPKPVFMELRTGMSSNEISGNHQWGFYANAGVGFKLATGKNFGSHIILSYNLVCRHSVTTIDEEDYVTIHRFKDLHLISLRLGVTF